MTIQRSNTFTSHSSKKHSRIQKYEMMFIVKLHIHGFRPYLEEEKQVN